MKCLRSALFAVVALFACSAVFAADVTVTWSDSTNPQAGWNLYYNHLQTPDALQYIGSIQPQERYTILHNISTTGLYQFALSRVDYTDVSGVNRRTETALTIITLLDGQFVSAVGGVTITGVTISE